MKSAGNKIGDEGARVLGGALKTNTTLKFLDLGCDQQGRKEAQRESMESTRAGGVTGQGTRLVLKERVHR